MIQNSLNCKYLCKVFTIDVELVTLSHDIVYYVRIKIWGYVKIITTKYSLLAIFINDN